MILFNSSLVIHIAGIVLIAGITLAGYILAAQVWRFIETGRSKSIALHSVALGMERLVAIGGMITIASGITMVIALHGVVVSQTWFRVKMVLVLIIILNAAIFAKRQNKKLQQNLTTEATVGSFTSLRKRLNTYYIIQAILLLCIFVLSVFRF